MKIKDFSIERIEDISYFKLFLSSIDMIVKQKFKNCFEDDNYDNFYIKYNNIFFKYIKDNLIDVFNYICNKKLNDIILLYNYINGESNICSKCGSKKKIISFNKGYKKCENCINNVINNINTKLDIISYINKSKYNISLLEFIKIDPVLRVVLKNKLFNTEEELYLYLYNTKPKLCETCGKPTQFIRFRPLKDRTAYKQFCCSECRNKWWANMLKNDNTMNRISKDKYEQMKLKNSEYMKTLIKNGQFTPNYTNSWCHSLYVISFIKNNTLVTKKYRSSWEVIFLLLNPNIDYEVLRIPYIGLDNKKHTYIVDFIDYINKKVYEVKPISCKNTQINIIKNNTLIDWCKTNNYECMYIDETYFYDKVFNKTLLAYTEDTYKNKLLNIITKYNYIKVE